MWEQFIELYYLSVKTVGHKETIKNLGFILYSSWLRYKLQKAYKRLNEPL